MNYHTCCTITSAVVLHIPTAYDSSTLLITVLHLVVFFLNTFECTLGYMALCGTLQAASLLTVCYILEKTLT